MKEQDKNEKSGQDNRGQDESHEKNPLEWVVFAVSTLLVSALLAYLIYMSVHMEGKPPCLLVKGERDSTDMTILRYKIQVVNTGDITAEDVKVQVTLTGSDGEKESGELTFPFVPHLSKREGWYQFSEEGVKGDVTGFQVVSYRKPG